MKKKEEKKPVTEIERKTVLTFFILLFPSMVITGLTTVPNSWFNTLLAIALFFYQAILLKNFIDDHYKLTY
uniref:Uncharacterized protein n=1 Tax=viral metagenome TaxID=1070528 RepID=A0A6M3JID4_9ZZZZ